MSSVVWTLLLGDASHALTPLFAAYEALLHEGYQWLDEMLKEFGDQAAELRAGFEGVQRGNVYAVAACIAVLASNISRFYAKRIFGEEIAATRFGADVQGVPFGEVLRVAGNAARHVPIDADTSIATLDALGITRRDDSVPHLLLELVGIRNLDRLVNELDILAHQIDHAKFMETYDPTNPPKLEPWMIPSTARSASAANHLALLAKDKPEPPREFDTALVTKYVENRASNELDVSDVQSMLSDPASWERCFYKHGAADKARGLPALDPQKQRWQAEDRGIRDEEAIRRCIEAYGLGHRGEPIRFPFKSE